MNKTITEHTCPCCGYGGLDVNPYENLPPAPWEEGSHGEPPYQKHYGTPSYDVCSCCGFEFGNDDNSGTVEPTTFERFRKEWIEEGLRWFEPSKKPEGWTIETQLSKIRTNLDERSS